VRIITGDFSDRRVVDLLDPSYALPAQKQHQVACLGHHCLQSPDITFCTIWDDQMLVGFGALERLSNHHGELKSMHTTQAMRRMEQVA